jgi:uncharacterized protein (DUF1778 family)
MRYNYMMTDYGAVKISPREADTLATAAMVRGHYATTSIFSRPNESARAVLRRAEAIEAACRKFAEHRAALESNQD